MVLILFQHSWNYRKHNIINYPELGYITSQPHAVWYVEKNIKKPIKRLSSRIHRLCKHAFPTQPTIVLYSITGRDVGGHSKGGLHPNDYLKYIRNVTDGIGDYQPLVIFEPDAIPHMSNMSTQDFRDRKYLIIESLKILTQSNALIYLDIGHPYWLKKMEAVDYLNIFMNESIKGFSLNTSNFVTTDKCINYGDYIANNIGCSYVIDTSRNGNEVDETFNPPNMKLGPLPTTKTNSDYCDAYLWIKTPGESDGAVNGWPKAGRFNAQKTVDLIRGSLG